jgi:hypothetical protein
MVPKELRRIVDAGPRHDPVLGEEGGSQMLEKLVGSPAPAPPMLEVHGERLDPLELTLDGPLVMGQRHALGHDVSHHLELLESDIGEDKDIPLERLPRTADTDLEPLRLPIGRPERLPEMGADLPQILRHPGRGNAEKHHRPIPEEDCHAGRPHSSPQGSGRGSGNPQSIERADQLHDQRRTAGPLRGAKRAEIDPRAREHRLRPKGVRGRARAGWGSVFSRGGGIGHRQTGGSVRGT